MYSPPLVDRCLHFWPNSVGSCLQHAAALSLTYNGNCAPNRGRWLAMFTPVVPAQYLRLVVCFRGMATDAYNSQSSLEAEWRLTHGSFPSYLCLFCTKAHLTPSVLGCIEQTLRMDAGAFFALWKISTQKPVGLWPPLEGGPIAGLSHSTLDVNGYAYLLLCAWVTFEHTLQW